MLQNGSQRGTSMNDANATVTPRERAIDTQSVGWQPENVAAGRALPCGGGKNFKVIDGSLVSHLVSLRAPDRLHS